MKYFVIFLIRIYQRVCSPLLHQLLGVREICRFKVSCSSYAIYVIEKHGMIKGLGMSVRRILACQPFGNRYGRTI